jgi:hypothetical protein
MFNCASKELKRSPIPFEKNKRSVKKAVKHISDFEETANRISN